MIKRFINSVGYALNGIKIGIKEERNMRIDITAMLFVWHLIPFYDFTVVEVGFIVFITFLIPAFELMNTAVERAVYKPDNEHYMPAGAAKDTAAGAVFIVAIGAAIVGAMVFLQPDGLRNVLQFYTENILHVIALISYIIIAYFFITMDNYRKKD